MKKVKFTHLLKTLLIASLIGLFGQSVSGQTSINAIGTAIPQNFNSGFSTDGATWTDGITLSDWYALGGDAAIPGTYVLNAGTAVNLGALCSFGNAPGSSERALGWIPTGSTSAISYYGWRLKNTSGVLIKNLKIEWRGQQWRRTPAGAKSLVLSYQTGSTMNSLTAGSWTTPASNSTFTSPNSGSALALDGNASGNYSDITTTLPVDLAAGQEIMIRWQDTRQGTTQQSLAIDNIVVTPLKNDQVITFTDNLTAKTFGDVSFQLNGSSNSGLTVSYSSDDTNVVTINGSTATIVGTGKANIIATQLGNSTYNPASPVSVPIWVKPKTPKIAVPTNIVSTSFDVNWTTNNGLNNSKTYYKIEIDTNPAFTTQDEIWTADNVYTTNTFDDGGFTYVHDTKYYYRIYAITDDNLWSDYSQASFIITGVNYQTYNIVATPTFTTAALSYSIGSFNWSNGDPAGRIVFMKEGTGAITLPSNNTTYTASTNWLSPGTQLGSSGYYCIYAGSGTSVSLTGLYPGRTYTVQAFEYQGQPGSEVYMTDVVGANNPITFVPWPTTTWTNSNGVATPENWNTAGRWDHDTIPTRNLHTAVLVYVDGNCQITAAAESNNLTIKAAHSSITPKLSVNTGQALNVVGLLTNSGAASALVIRSAVDVPNGTLTFGSGTPSGTVEMYTKSYMTSVPPSVHQNKWQFFGIPVNSVTVGNSFAGYPERVRKYYEPNITAVTAHPEIPDYGLWIPADTHESQIGESTTMTAGQSLVPIDGYEVVQPSSKTYSFSGVLNHGDFSKDLPKTSGADWSGFHIVANPFTAAIDISKLSFGSNLDAAVYLYNSGSRADWETNNGGHDYGVEGVDGILPGQYVASNLAFAGVLGTPQQIPSMQGFCVLSNGNTNNTFGMPYSSVMTNNTAQRAPRSIKSEKVGTRIDVIGANFADRMWIFTEPTCTHNFDNGFDGYKLSGSALTPQIYAMEADNDYQIDAVNDMNNTYLGFKVGLDTDLKLKFTHQNAESYYGSIFLVDLVANKTIDITVSGTEYTFSSVSNSATKRFKIITQTTGTTAPTDNTDKLKMFNSENAIYVQNNTGNTANYMLYNVSAKLMQRVSVDANSIKTISTIGLNSGVYIAKSETETVKVTQRFIIR